MKDFSNEIWGYGLKNAVEFGKADAGKILPKLFQHGLERTDIGNIMPIIQEIVKEINRLKEGEKSERYNKFKKFVKEREEEEKGLPDIAVPNGMKVVTRMAPEPSKYNHLGHALTFLLNYVYAKKYDGKCFLRFEDTNPEKVSQEYVDAMKEDVLEYLGIKPDGIRFVSDDMEILYDYAEKLVNMEKAYMCFCEREEMQEFRHKGIECSCRQLPKEIHIERWKEFLKGKNEKGEAVLRIKGDMQSLNHVMRDPVIFRTVNAKHYKYGNKYKIWPMYDFYNPIEDSLMGVTLILRSNEFDTRVELQDYIKDLLGLSKQTIVQYGRFNVMDFITQGREIRELVDSGNLIGWDDPRLMTLKALKRRGIVKETFYELLNQIGLVKHPVNLSFDMIAAINRKIIDKKADRYYFVEEPREIGINGIEGVKEVEMPIHPDKDGKRKVKVGKIFVSRKDFDEFKGKEVRLLHLANIKLKEDSKITGFDNKNLPRIQWVSDSVRTKVLMEDGNWVSGFAESSIKDLKAGSIVQFERFGFVKFDRKNKEGEYEFWFGHK